MEKLDTKYLEQLEQIKQELNNSETYQRFLENEEEEDYNELQDTFNPKLSALYHQVANEKPLQLIEFERALLDDGLEGLFLSRVLGYTVMRGVINEETYKYILSQEHFKEVLNFICHSPNFDFLRKRIGQTIQLGFGLSSDIWVTNFINGIANRKVKNYLLAQRDSKYRFKEYRSALYRRYQKQFAGDNYFTAVFPESMPQLSVYFPELRNFLIQRARLNLRDQSLSDKLVNFVLDRQYFGSREQFELLVLTANFVDLNEEQKEKIGALFNELRTEMDDFDEKYLKLLISYHNLKLPLDEKADRQVLSLIKPTGEDDSLYAFYKLSAEIHDKGFTHPDVVEAIKKFYDTHDGTSLENQAVRNILLRYAGRVLTHLTPEEYPEFFTLMDELTQYIMIFDNQKFNQQIKDYALPYVKKLIKHFTDKRGKDYQAIKRYVQDKFQELGFMKPKELVDLFKTRRIRRKTAQKG